jgi:protein gp37
MTDAGGPPNQKAHMSENSKIEWCDHTFNPWEGCQKTGPGCDNCYAEARNARFGGGTAINFGPCAPRRRTSAANWALPKRWNAQADAFMALHGRRQRVFCASLADWLDNQVDTEWLVDLLEVVRTTPNLDWLLLSKRIGTWRARIKTAFEWVWVNARVRLAELLSWLADWLDGKPPANVWIGATIVNQPEADRDIAKLLAVPARVRYLSMEPLLGPVNLTSVPVGGGHGHHEFDPIITGNALQRATSADPSVHWVIVGGESGPNARPMHPDWARSLRDQCDAAGVPFLFKQWGEWLPADSDGETVSLTFPAGAPSGPDNPRWYSWPCGVQSARVGKKAAGRHLDGRTWDGAPTL